MSLWSRLRRMFGRVPSPPRDPAVRIVVSESRAEVSETRDLLEQLRATTEKRRLAIARRHYEERLHGTEGH